VSLGTSPNVVLQVHPRGKGENRACSLIDVGLFGLTLAMWRELHNRASDLAEAFVFLEHKEQLTFSL